MNALRSWLFVPGSSKRMLEKSRTIAADALVFDLEDSVSYNQKKNARQNISGIVQDRWPRDIYVRTNSVNSPTVFDEVMDLSTDALAGFVLPKIEQARDLIGFSYFLDFVEQHKGLPSGKLKIVPIIETSLGLSNVQDIGCSSPRISRLAFGAVDFSFDIGVKIVAPEVLDYARSLLVVASRATGIAPPIDAVHTDLRDMEGLATVAYHAKSMGFSGKFAIHPNQVDVLNDVFSVNDSEKMEARNIVTAYEDAIAQGEGSVQVNGKMIDRPVYDFAKELLI